MNIVVDVSYLISGIYTNLHSLPVLWKKCDVGYYVFNHCVVKLMIIQASVYIFNFIITQNSYRMPKLNTRNCSLYFPYCM